jgi:hypothetical protein
MRVFIRTFIHCIRGEKGLGLDKTRFHCDEKKYVSFAAVVGTSYKNSCLLLICPSCLP